MTPTMQYKWIAIPETAHLDVLFLVEVRTSVNFFSYLVKFTT